MITEQIREDLGEAAKWIDDELWDFSINQMSVEGAMFVEETAKIKDDYWVEHEMPLTDAQATAIVTHSRIARGDDDKVVNRLNDEAQRYFAFRKTLIWVALREIEEVEAWANGENHQSSMPAWEGW